MVARAPRKRMYRTMQGRMVDIERLRAANESVQAVGNMKVNAKGDVIGPGGKVIKSKEEEIKNYYEQPKGVVSDTPRSKSMPAPEQAKPTVQKMTPVPSKPTPKTASKKTVAPQPKKVEVKPTPTVESKPVETFKPKSETTSKSGIDAALDGLE